MNEKKFEGILQLTAPKKYAHFVKRVADFEEVWGLNLDGWAMSETDEGVKTIPFWSHSKFAEDCAIEEWEGYKPNKIDMDEFVDDWLKNLEDQKIDIVIMMDQEGNGINVKPQRLKADLEEELENY